MNYEEIKEEKEVLSSLENLTVRVSAEEEEKSSAIIYEDIISLFN